MSLLPGFFGGYNGTLMPRPDKETRFRLRGKLLPFLERNGLAILKPAFEQYFMLFGYGYALPTNRHLCGWT